MEKSFINAKSVTIPHLGQVLWVHIRKRTVEKSQTNATNVSSHQPSRASWQDIWKHTLGTNQTNATSVILQPMRQTIWRNIWKHTMVNIRKKLCDSAYSCENFWRRHSEIHIRKRNKWNQFKNDNNLFKITRQIWSQVNFYHLITFIISCWTSPTWSPSFQIIFPFCYEVTGFTTKMWTYRLLIIFPFWCDYRLCFVAVATFVTMSFHIHHISSPRL